MGGLHKFFLAIENLFDYVGLFLIDSAFAVYHLPTYVIHKDRGHIKFTTLLDSIASFRIGHNNIMNTAVNLIVIHWGLPLSHLLYLLYHKSNYLSRGFSKVFEKFFQSSPDFIKHTRDYALLGCLTLRPLTTIIVYHTLGILSIVIVYKVLIEKIAEIVQFDEFWALLSLAPRRT